MTSFALWEIPQEEMVKDLTNATLDIRTAYLFAETFLEVADTWIESNVSPDDYQKIMGHVRDAERELYLAHAALSAARDTLEKAVKNDNGV